MGTKQPDKEKAELSQHASHLAEGAAMHPGASNKTHAFDCRQITIKLVFKKKKQQQKRRVSCRGKNTLPCSDYSPDYSSSYSDFSHDIGPSKGQSAKCADEPMCQTDSFLLVTSNCHKQCLRDALRCPLNGSYVYEQWKDGSSAFLSRGMKMAF